MPKSPIPAGGGAMPAACTVIRLHLARLLLRLGRWAFDTSRTIIEHTERDRHDR